MKKDNISHSFIYKYDGTGNELNGSSVYPIDNVVKDEKKYKYERGLCCGVFDGLHHGHLNLLENAKKYCKELYIGLSNDKYVEVKKGRMPIFDFEHRKRVLEMLRIVDKVVEQGLNYDKNANTKHNMVSIYNCDVIIAGDDWKAVHDWDGYDCAVAVLFLPYTKGISTTSIIEKIRKK